MLTVGGLRKALDGLPDDMPVVLPSPYGATWESVDDTRLVLGRPDKRWGGWSWCTAKHRQAKQLLALDSILALDASDAG